MDLVRNSWVRSFSLTANSRTVLFSRSRSSRVLVTPKMLLTVFLDFRDEFIQLFDDDDRSIHAGQQILEILLLEFLALSVPPILLGLCPVSQQLLRHHRQPGSIGIDAHLYLALASEG